MVRRLVATLAVVLVLGGCGPAATGALVGLATGGAGFLGAAVQEDITQAAEWRGRHQALVAQVQAALMAQARTLEDENWGEAMAVYERALQFSLDNQPQILLERMRDRLGD